MTRDDRSISLYLTCQPSGGANGSDARSSTPAKNVDRRRTSAKPAAPTTTFTRPPAAKRRPKVTANRPDRADLTGTRNPRKPKNPGNHKTRVVGRTRNPVAVVSGPRSQRPIPGSIY